MAEAQKESAYDFLALLDDFNLGTLKAPIMALIAEGYEGRDLDLQLRENPVYKSRFKANEDRIKAGLQRLSPLDYIKLEESYKEIADFYGLPEVSYRSGEGGFDTYIGKAISPREFEGRITTGQERLKDTLPDVSKTLRDLYPEVGEGDLLGYVLNPKATLPEIQKKITAAEIGTAAQRAGLTVGGIAEKDLAAQRTRAEELRAAGINAERAAQGFAQVAEELPRTQQLASIYGQQPYTQATAEAAVFNLAGAPEARRRKQKLVELEQAIFSGRSGTTQGALSRERAGQF